MHPPSDWTETFLVLLVVLITGAPSCCALDCFKCVSVGGNNPMCDEPFHNNYTADVLESPCMGGRKGRNGLFPSTACLKLSGTYEDSGQTMVVRGCGLDSGTVTVDTEIVRMSHCGGFYFDDRYVSGCLQSCFEDACNAGLGQRRLVPATATVVSVALMLYALCSGAISWSLSFPVRR